MRLTGCVPAAATVAVLLLSACGGQSSSLPAADVSPASTAAPSPTAADSPTPTDSPTPAAALTPADSPTTEATPSAAVDAPEEIAASLGVRLVDPVAAGMVDFSLVGFRSPSGTIRCGLYDPPPGSKDPAFARCDISNPAYSAPAKPPDCDFDYGRSVVLNPGKPAAYGCVSDAMDGRGVLPYGSAVLAGDLLCISRSTGVTCQTTDGRHGFQLSSAGAVLH